MSFADDLRKARTQRGLSQSQAAACVPYLSVRTLQEWEQGHQQPPLWSQNLLIKQIAERKKVVAVGAKRSCPKRKKSNRELADETLATRSPETK